jgi:transposase
MEMICEKVLEKMKGYFPRARGKPRVDDRKVIGGIVYVLRNGLRWQDAPKHYGAHQTLYNRFSRWSKRGIFAKIFEELARGNGKLLMMDATHIKAHRTAASLKGGRKNAKSAAQKAA